MTYDFDTIVKRAGSSCIKYDTLKETFGTEDVLPMWIADMDFPAAPFIMDAIMRRAMHPCFGYGIREDDYYNAIINWVERHNHWNIEKGWIDFTPGVVAGFSFAIRALTAEGDGVLIMPPTYPPFAAQIKANGRKVVCCPMANREGHFEIDFELLDQKLAEAKAILFCNPHNPTGRVFTEEELRRVGELCLKHNVNIISDEIHSDLIQKPYHHTHLASLSEALAERTVTLIAPTKTFNIAGLSTSVMITPGEALRAKVREELNRYHIDQGNLFGTTTLIAAYNEGDEWLEQLLDYIAGNMQLVSDFFAEKMPEVVARKSEGTYMMWLDFRGLGMTHEELCKFLAEEAHVGLNDGASFGEEGRGFMRINLATSREMVQTALDRIYNAWSSRK